MIHIGNNTITTAKSATYLGNVGSILLHGSSSWLEALLIEQPTLKAVSIGRTTPSQASQRRTYDLTVKLVHSVVQIFWFRFPSLLNVPHIDGPTAQAAFRLPNQPRTAESRKDRSGCIFVGLMVQSTAVGAELVAS
jgi:hypothetical protein